MGFQIVGQLPESEAIWVPIDRTTQTSLYVGQLVKIHGTGVNGAAPLAVASGVCDTTGAQVIAGVVMGDNNYTPTFLATYGQYAASVQTQAEQAARNFFGVEGTTFIKGDPQPFVKIGKINALTKMSAPIFNATYGTAPTVSTVTTGSTTGAGMTSSAVDVTPVANMCTAYCRTGLNSGIYRICKDAHATIHTFDTYYSYDITIGDTFVILPYRIGFSAAQINATAGYLGMCFSCAVTPATDYFGLDVYGLDFKVSGKEKIYFKFSPNHFTGV